MIKMLLNVNTSYADVDALPAKLILHNTAILFLGCTTLFCINDASFQDVPEVRKGSSIKLRIHTGFLSSKIKKGSVAPFFYYNNLL